jgi:pimeloyl-ACP methyl ester carboxylesterase
VAATPIFKRAGGLTTLFLAGALASGALAATKPERQVFALRGRDQVVYHLMAGAPSDSAHPPVLFLTGDGGWHGAAIDMARMIASLGYEVYGLDVKRYLTSFTSRGSTLDEARMAADLEQVIQRVSSANQEPVLLVGWSQGAAMAVLAAARSEPKGPLEGVLTVALPEEASLGWRRRDTLRSLFRLEPHEPRFNVAPLLRNMAQVPIWMVYGTKDRFTPASIARRLVRVVRGPKRQHEIQDADHDLSGHRADLRRSLSIGLAWLAGQPSQNALVDGVGIE